MFKEHLCIKQMQKFSFNPYNKDKLSSFYKRLNPSVCICHHHLYPQSRLRNPHYLSSKWYCCHTYKLQLNRLLCHPRLMQNNCFLSLLFVLGWKNTDLLRSPPLLAHVLWFWKLCHTINKVKRQETDRKEISMDTQQNIYANNIWRITHQRKIQQKIGQKKWSRN